jgi:hypothetical protein
MQEEATMTERTEHQRSPSSSLNQQQHHHGGDAMRTHDGGEKRRQAATSETNIGKRQRMIEVEKKFFENFKDVVSV